MNEYYFVSTKYLQNQLIYPKLPNNRLTKSGRENNIISRICVSKSIIGCFHSTNIYEKHRRVYLYKCVSNNVITPDIKDVSDAHLTGEEWILEPIKLKLVCTLFIKKESLSDNLCKYIVSDKDEIIKFTLYEFDYEKYYKNEGDKHHED